MVAPTIAALIPARSGSRRIPHKNIRLLRGHPLLAYTIRAAQESGIFKDIVVSSDDPYYGNIAVDYGARFFLRPVELAQDDSPDILWVMHALANLTSDAFAILRPTSPFRGSSTIRLAWERFLEAQPADSLRAIRLVREHPGKMWLTKGEDRMVPLLPFEGPVAPWHSMATQSLPRVYVQTGGLEIAWVKTVTKTKTIAGSTVIPFGLQGREALDINTEEDWAEAERMAELLPAMERVKA